MALNFTNATSDRLDIGSGTALDNINTGTFCAWVYRTANTTTRYFWGKGAGTTRHTFVLNGGGSPSFELLFPGGPTINVAAALANFSGISNGTNVWQFVAVTWKAASSGGVAGDQRIYNGDLSNPCVEASSYSFRSLTGTPGDDSASNMLIGNASTLTNAFEGYIGATAFYNRQLSVAELRSMQYQFRKLDATCVDLRYLFDPTWAVKDYSGTFNAGTVTGATVAPKGLPLRPLGAPAFARSPGGYTSGSVVPSGWARRRRIVVARELEGEW